MVFRSNLARIPVSAGGRQLLSLVFKTGGISQASLTRRLDLAQPTVARLLHGFVDAGLATLEARVVDRPGHPSVTARINPDYASALGVSIFNDAVSLVLVDCAGRILGTRHASLPGSRAQTIDLLLGFRDAVIGESGADPRRVLGLGVGISAFFTGEGSRMVAPPALEDWTLIDLQPLLEDAFDLPVIVENDGAAGAIGESLFGVGRQVENFAYLHLTNGFGGGIISEGRLFRGARGNAGEFGGIWTVGRMGYPNLDRLRVLVAEAEEAYPSVDAMLSEIAPSTPGVDAWLDEATHAFSTLAAVLAYTIDPQAIVIGGRLPAAIADRLVERIDPPRAPNRHDLAPPAPAILRSTIEWDAVALGAAVMPIQRAFLV